ncbi:MAG: hypothetical protein ACXVGN_02100, partial [Mycobacteriaceae bacterium]
RQYWRGGSLEESSRRTSTHRWNSRCATTQLCNLTARRCRTTNAVLAAAPTLGLPVLAWTIPNTATRGLN